MRTLLLDLEHEARERSENLERDGRLPPGFTAKHYPMPAADYTELRRLKSALLLAEDADTFVALANNRPVPRERSWFLRRLAEIQRRR